MKLKKSVAVSETGLLFHPETGESYSVNPIGIEVINLMKEGKSFDEIRALILERYNTDKETFEKDFQDYIGILIHHDLIDD
jgi:hypothetical protein